MYSRKVGEEVERRKDQDGGERSGSGGGVGLGASRVHGAGGVGLGASGKVII